MKDTNETINDLESILSKLEPFDVLSKCGFVSMLIYSDFFEKMEGNKQIYRDVSRVVNAYYMTHKTSGCNKMDYDIYKQICDLFNELSTSLKINNFQNNQNLNSIAISKNITTEILPAFKFCQIDTMLPFQDDIVRKQFNLNHQTILDELHSFYGKVFQTKKKVKNNSLIETINNFDVYYDANNFEFVGTQSKELVKSITSSVGTVDLSLFSWENFHFTFDVGRKCGFEFNNHFYFFDIEVLISRFCKCVERSCSSFKLEWNQNLKDWTEEMPCSVLKHYLKDGKALSNNFYYTSKQNRNENDLLFIYKNNLLIIEIKGEKVNPDPLSGNEELVEKSYVNVIEKGIKQTQSFINLLKEKGSLNIYDEKKNLKETIVNNFCRIIPIVITFEEMPAFLPDYMIHNAHFENDNPVLINFYDFLVVLDYLSNPLLIIDYFAERSKITNKHSMINDELFYLGVYTKDTVHLCQYIDENGILDRNDFSASNRINNFFFDVQDWTIDIENYYSNVNQKKPIFTSMNPIVFKMLNTNFDLLDNELFDKLYLFMKGLSSNVHEKMISKYKAGSSMAIITLKELKIGYYIKSKTTENSKDYYAFLLYYFTKNVDVNYVIVAKEGKTDFAYERVFRNSVIFLDKEIIEKSYFYGLSWKRSEFEN